MCKKPLSRGFFVLEKAIKKRDVKKVLVIRLLGVVF